MSRRRGRDRDRGEVAIVGMACRFPGAGNLVEYWQNILGGVDATTEVPTTRWNLGTFFDPTGTRPDRVSCRRGGYLAEPIPFDAASHGIMPRAVDGGEPEQFLILDAARQALVDAGMPDGPESGRRVDVVVGRGNYLNRGNLTRLAHGRLVEQALAILESVRPGLSDDDREAIRRDLRASLPPFGPETVPGMLTNGVAGRVADRLNFRGAAFVVDAASASALVALDLARRSLLELRSDLALVGAAYLEADVDFPLVFRQLGALSRSGRSMPFAADADGLLSGEGAGVVVLKRLADAERDGDRVYAVVKGVGIASDGRGPGLSAPSARGHALAIRRGLREARVDPSTVALIEGHGLGLPAADRAEIRAIRANYPAPPRPSRRAIGAVSSMIGHAMPAAGMAGLIKAALALHHRVIPPTLHAGDRPHPLLDRPDSPARPVARARPWVHGSTDAPRRAAVNAFGFAGINTHAVLEAHPSSDRLDAPGAMHAWDTEAFLFAGQGRHDLADRVEAVARRLAEPFAPDVTLKDLAATINAASTGFGGSTRLGVVARSVADLADRLSGLLPRLRDPKCGSIRDARGAYFWDRGDETNPPPVAFMFPGEGSQYPGMLGDLAQHFPEIRELLDTSDRLHRGSKPDDSPWPSEVLYETKPSGDDPLWGAEVAVNVVLSSQWGLYRLLRRLDIAPDAVVGHSSGEFLALAAAGILQVDRAFEEGMAALGSLFGRLESSGDLPAAKLVALATNRDKVDAAIGELGLAGDLAVAMDNCPHQVVVAGDPASADRLADLIKARGVPVEVLPFARAYHTPSFAPAVGPISAFLAESDAAPPALPIYSCASAARMPAEPGAVLGLAEAQWTRPVEFRQTVEAMHRDGLRVFIDVGARGNLAGFVEDTLRGRPSFAIAANLPRRSGTTQLNHLVASVFAQGVSLDPAHLYARRRPKAVDLDASAPPARPTPRLLVGFPSMTLSEEMVGRLADRGDEPSRPPGDDHLSPLIGDTFEPEPTSVSVVEDAWPGAGTTVMGDFQRTMVDFLDAQRSVMAGFLGQPLGPTEPTDEAGPWAGALVSFDPGASATSIYSLRPGGDPVAEHHTLGGRRVSAAFPDRRGLPVLPFSVMAEMLAEAGARLAPAGWCLVGLREVRAHKWVRYEEEGPVTLEIVAEVVAEEPGLIRVTIYNRGRDDSPRLGDPAVFDGLAEFGPDPLDPPEAGPFAVDDPRPCRFTADSIYRDQWLFHGPALQAVSAIGPIGPTGIEGTLRVLPREWLLRDPDDALRLLTDPIILDNFTHLLGGWGLDELADRGDVIFPLRMGHLAIFGGPPADGSEVSCRVAVESIERHRVCAGADVVRADGTTWMAIRGWEDWRFHWPGRYRDGFRRPDATFLGEALPVGDLHGVAAVWLEPPGDMGRPVWRDVLEFTQLDEDERRAYQSMPGPEDRRTARLWGRIAAKEAVRRLEVALGAEASYPGDLWVVQDELGRPWVGGRSGTWDGSAWPGISIAHTEGVAVALATVDPSARPGIDVEPIIDRSEAFESMAFTEVERAWLDDLAAMGLSRPEWVARFWCGKEAAAKATGFGFVDGPGGAQVSRVIDLATGILGVTLEGRLAEACPDLAGRMIAVTTDTRDDFAWAWTEGRSIEP